MTTHKNIDEYIATYPEGVQILLEQVRSSIKKAAPEAEEVISYGMPAFRHKGMMVWFGAHTKHIGFYPRASGVEEFKHALSTYKVSKGAIQFPFELPLPLDLITEIVKFRVKENLQEALSRKK